jgi:hypothetical protein
VAGFVVAEEMKAGATVRAVALEENPEMLVAEARIVARRELLKIIV